MQSTNPLSARNPSFFPLRCPQASGCAGTGIVESYVVRWVDVDHAHRTAGAASEREAGDAAQELLREGALCACVWRRAFTVRS